MSTEKIYSKENQWFRENERYLLEQEHKEREKKLETYRKENEKTEREKLRLAHWLKCPKCGNDMKAENIEGIELERCSVCTGAFFDHGELEALLMRKTENRFKFYRRMFNLD